MKRCTTTVLIVLMMLPVLVGVRPALAQPRLDFVIIQPGQPGTPEDAQPVMDALAAYLQNKLGKQVAIQGRYFNRADSAQAYLQTARPRWGIVGLGFFLENRERFDLRPAAATRPGGSDQDLWRLVVGPKGPAQWRQIQGKVSGTMLFDQAAAGQLLFASHPGQLPFALEGTFQPLAAVRAVLAGRTAGAVLDRPQWEALQALPQFTQLRVLLQSKPLPTSPVVTFGAPDARTAQLTKVLQGMEQDPAAASLLQLLQTEGFGPVDGRLATLKLARP